MQETHNALKELQRIDEEIDRLEQKVSEFAPLLEEVDEPVNELQGEVDTTRGRLQELKLEERRLETTAEEKRNRMNKLEDRLKNVRNIREEAAVQAELDLVRRAAEADEKEALSLLDQIRKLELRLDEQEEALESARAEVEPRRRELEEERDRAEQELEELVERRERFADEINPRERRLYEQIRSGGRDVAVTHLTRDGACGNCFGMIPPQLQNELRHGEAVIRCEACGVILAPPEEPGEEGSGG